MQVGDLVKLGTVGGGLLGKLRGIILDIFEDPEGDFGALLASVLWTDGDKTTEFFVDLEVVCK